MKRIDTVGRDVTHNPEVWIETDRFMNSAGAMARYIIAQWPTWENEAGLASQVEQSPEAGDALLMQRLTASLTELIEEAALVCEGRANVRQGQLTVYGEAMKCADQIRHNMLANSCEACGGDGYFKGARLGDERCPECLGTGSRGW